MPSWMAFDMRLMGERFLRDGMLPDTGDRDRLPFAFEDLGEHQVKNIARPVRVYRVQEETAEEPGAGVGDFVQRKPCPGEFGEDRQKTGAGGRFQNHIGGSERGRFGGHG